MEKSVREVIEEVCEEMCMNYCKYTEQSKECMEDGHTLDVCDTCPLNRLN